MADPKYRYSPASGGSRANDGALGGPVRIGDVRAYPRHARSLSARTVRQRVLVLGSVLVLAAITAVIAVPKSFHRRPAAPGQSPALSAAAMVRGEAAEWVSRWVAPGAIVGCDLVMCSLLLKHDLRAGDLMQLTAKASDPLGSSIVVATPALRSQLGRRLISVYAPDVLASFGSGSTRIDIRVVAADGSQAYEQQLRADWQARKANGAQLLHNAEISASRPARRDLAGGEVDSRLLIILPVLVHFCGPVRVVRFGGAGPGRSRGMPLLAAFITPLVRRGESAAAKLTARRAAKIVAFLKAQWTFIKATSSIRHDGPGGQVVVQLDVTAPPQLNAFNGNPVITAPITAPSK
ncbi:MAG TPA: hypothetical protein VMA95_00435 [Streptosporangiaceae bacterium]|nr:hypothetical protein [Streptosporangiaceae bacterium]